MKQLVELKSLLDEQARQTTQILLVSVDTHEESQKLIALLEQEGEGDIDFPFLEDQNHQVINRYGLLNPQGKSWPHPATYVIDRQGVVRWKFIETDYKIRPANAVILEALKAVQ